MIPIGFYVAYVYQSLDPQNEGNGSLLHGQKYLPVNQLGYRPSIGLSLSMYLGRHVLEWWTIGGRITCCHLLHEPLGQHAGGVNHTSTLTSWCGGLSL